MRQKRLTESQRVSKQNRGGKKRLHNCVPLPRQHANFEFDSSLYWELHPEFSENNWETSMFQKNRLRTDRFCSAGLVSATRYKDLKIDMMPSAPPADGRDDSTAALLKSWAVPENGLSTITCGQITLKVNFPPRRPSRCFLSVVSQQLILILLRIHRFLTVCRTFSGLRTVGQRQALGQICWQRSGSTPPRTW